MDPTQRRASGSRALLLLIIQVMVACEDQVRPDSPADAAVDASNWMDAIEVSETGAGADAGRDADAGSDAEAGETVDAAIDSAPVVVGVLVTPANAIIFPGMSLPMQAHASHGDGTTLKLDAQVTWSSSHPLVATISDSGVVAAINTGRSEISARYQGVVGSTTLTVGSPAIVDIRVTPTSATISRGMSSAFRAHLLFSNDTSLDITEQVVWSAENAAIASVSNQAGQRGVVQAVAVGQTRVGAMANGLSDAANLTVTGP